MKRNWAVKKELGNYRFPRRHPDVKRNRLNVKGMKKLKKMDKRSHRTEWRLVFMTKWQVLVRGIFKPWRWKLSITWKDNVAPTQFYLEERGKGDRFVLGGNYEKKD